MKKEKAVQILKAQQQTLPSLNKETYEVWKTNTLSWIRLLFGESSEEYKHFKDFHFWEFDIYNPEAEIRKNIPKANSFLENCITRINAVGLPKKEWKHVLITTNPTLFWAVFVVLMGGMLWLGQHTANKSDETSNKSSANKNDDSSVHKNVFLNDTTKSDSSKK